MSLLTQPPSHTRPRPQGQALPVLFPFYQFPLFQNFTEIEASQDVFFRFCLFSRSIRSVRVIVIVRVSGLFIFIVE